MIANARREQRVLVSAWLALALASVAAALLVQRDISPRLAGTVAVLLMAFKINLVIAHFIEVRWSCRPLRSILTTWVGAVTLLLLSSYWL